MFRVIYLIAAILAVLVITATASPQNASQNIDLHITRVNLTTASTPRGDHTQWIDIEGTSGGITYHLACTETLRGDVRHPCMLPMTGLTYTVRVRGNRVSFDRPGDVATVDYTISTTPPVARHSRVVLESENKY